MRQTQYSNHVQHAPLTTASQHNRRRTEFARARARHPAAPLIRDEEARAPAACPMGRSREGYHGHSRATPLVSRTGWMHVTRIAEET